MISNIKNKIKKAFGIFSSQPTSPRALLLSSGAGAAIALAIFATISIASAALTFNGTTVTGDGAVSIDGASTISIGNSTATSITIGQSGKTVTLPGTVSANSLIIPSLATGSANCLKVDSSGNVTTFSCSGGGGLTVGSSSISGGTTGDVLYNNSGVLGNEAVPTLDSNGRVIPGGGSYGGVLGNDSSGYNFGPAIFSNGNQILTFNDGGGSDPALIIGNPQPSDGAAIKLVGNGLCQWASWGANWGDGALNKNAGGCNNPNAALMMQENNQTIMDFEPDYHPKFHDNSGNPTVSPTFTGGAGVSNCGTGATFDKGSNDGAGRIVVGSSPPNLCRVTWMFQYANALPAWENAAPNCSVQNEGHRATGSITIATNPTNGDTVTIQGTTVTFGSDVPIGSTTALTAANLLNFVAGSGPAGAVVPGTAPGTNPTLAQFDYALSGSTVTLTYTYMDGVTGNSATLSTSSGGRVTVSGSTLSGGAASSTRYVVAQSGTGGMTISAPGGSLNAGDVLTYTCIAYW